MTKTNMNINGERMPRFCGKEEKHKNSIIAKIWKNLKIIFKCKIWKKPQN